MAFRDGSLTFAQSGALPTAALEKVITAMRERDIEQVRNDTEQQRSA